MKVGIFEYKAKKGLIRASVTLFEDKINVKITGDFMVFPEDVIVDLENNLKDIPPDERIIGELIEKSLSKAIMVGCTIDDFKLTIINALKEVKP